MDYKKITILSGGPTGSILKQLRNIRKNILILCDSENLSIKVYSYSSKYSLFRIELAQKQRIVRLLAVILRSKLTETLDDFDCFRSKSFPSFTLILLLKKLMTQSFDILLSKFKEYLAANPFEKEPLGLYQPVDYILNLGGKRIRPVLLLMAGNLFSDEVERALPAAYAIEIFHCFSLVHDDIMDAAPLRRGKPSVHVKYSINTGILSGDVMLIHAYGYLLKSTEHMTDPREVLHIFNRVAIEVCEGQQMDMDFETRDDVSIPEYLKMIELKTSVLIGGALEVGALISGASSADARLLADFGKNIGLAFQLQDDILDTFGDSASFGKKIGGDIAQNKKTFLYLKAREKADEKTLATLDRLYQTDVNVEEIEKIRTVTNIFTQLNIEEDTERLKEDYLNQAFQALDALSVPSERKEHLVNLSNQLMGRKV